MYHTARLLFLLPLIGFFFIPMGFFITYAISVLVGSVSPLFPMISDTGTTHPSNYVFGAIVHFGSLVYCVTGLYVYTIRRMLISRASNLTPWRKTTAVWVNRLMPIGLLISTLGAIVVAHVEYTQNPILHFVGTLICFGGAMAYMTLTTILSLAMPLMRWLSTVRVAICVTTSVCFVGFITHLHYVVKYGIQQQQSPTSIFIGRFHIDPQQNDTNWTVVKALAMGSFCEWLMAFCYGFYMLTFAVEFGKIRVRLPVPVIDQAAADVYGKDEPKEARPMPMISINYNDFRH
uniref:DNA damage-regulated autophagy modulator protein 2 n=1 Tax=Plectus sambesii TaxID=2011161 RepID=A0A914WAA8_9BILA